MKKSEVSKEQIAAFLNGSNPMERIIKIEGSYREDKIYVIYRDDKGALRTQVDSFYPFVWCKAAAARLLYGGDRKRIKEGLLRHGIGCKGLRIADTDGNIHPRMENGYRVLFFAQRPMSYGNFMKFFEEAGRPIYPQQGDINYGMREYIAVSPIEQYMISTGKRMFKGYEDYNDVLRMQWDLETEGLDPKVNAISQIGIRTNKGFEKILTVTGTGMDRLNSELAAIRQFFRIMKEISPDVITGHNTENFDWNFIIVRLEILGSSIEAETKPLFYDKGIYKKKKQQVLKLGGEMEYYFPTVMWGHNITDSLFAVRRAQAIDSNMKKADLKYVTKYSKLNKPNRVYVPGKIINSTWEDQTRTYAFNDENGHWFKITDKVMGKTFVNESFESVQQYEFSDNRSELVNVRTGERFSLETGRYIVERYLLDDLWETDMVECRYNQSNFLVGKMLPVSFEKACTMGTAAIWKYILLAWSYEENLGIPELIESHPFTGGLSRLLKVGYVDRIVKLDFNSLYPSIILTFNITSPVDIMGTMTTLLEYILTKREYYKGLKAEYGDKADALKKEIDKCNTDDTEKIHQLKTEQKKAEAEANRNDKLQLPLKITGNGFFGSYGSGHVFPWSDLICAEETTCSGRMMLRLMISHFTNLGYSPIVGDSFTADTPLFVKENDTGMIDIKNISELIDESHIQVDDFGREYDTSKKGFKVLCRSGWMETSYIYRHKPSKRIYEVLDEDVSVEVTEDHSLYDSSRNEISPKNATTDTILEKFDNVSLYTNFNNLTAVDNVDGKWKWLLNAKIRIKRSFIESINGKVVKGSKKDKAAIQFIRNCVRYNDEKR